MAMHKRATRSITLLATFIYVFTLGSEINLLRVLSLARPLSTDGLTDALYAIFTTTLLYVITLRCIRLARTRSELDGGTGAGPVRTETAAPEMKDCAKINARKDKI